MQILPVGTRVEYIGETASYKGRQGVITRAAQSSDRVSNVRVLFDEAAPRSSGREQTAWACNLKEVGYPESEVG